MGEDEIDGPDGSFELPRTLQELRQQGNGAAPFVLKAVRIVANDVKDVEAERGAAQMRGHLPMRALDQGHASLTVLSHILRPIGAPFDEVHDEKGRHSVKHPGRNLCRSRGLRCGQFVELHDAMHGNVPAVTHDRAATAVGNEIVLIGDAAGKRLDFDRTAPDRNGADRGLRIGGVGGHCEVPSSSMGRFKWAAPR